MQRMLMPYENLKEIIMKSAFGCFILTNLSGTEVLGGSHIMKENEAEKFTPEKIIECLNDLTAMIGPGDYRIALKKTPKTQIAGEVTYRFFVPSTQTQQPQQTQGMGYSPQDFDSKVAAAVEKAISHQRELDKRDRQIERLNEKLDELKKTKKGDYDELYKQGGDLLKMGFAGWLIKEVPASANVINGILNGELNEESEQEETTYNIKRTD